MLLPCDRDKRDINFSDEPTDEDLNRFKWTLPLRKRHKRESGRISKENATYFCEERVSNTKIGKLCAKIGINAQALVNACSFDLEVNYSVEIIVGGGRVLYQLYRYLFYVFGIVHQCLLVTNMGCFLHPSAKGF